MKKVIGWPVSQGLWLTGHCTSKLMEHFDFGYPFYNWCMGYSVIVNDWAGLHIWVRAKS